jgi:uncharacterized peroxidase-related enzyme
MAFIRTIPANEADGDVREMYARQQERWGYVPNYAKLFSHRPGLMKYWGAMQEEIRRQLDPRRYELVTLAVASTLRSSACSLVHGTELAGYYSETEIKAIVRGGTLSELSAADQAMIIFARKIAVDAASVTAGDIARLQSHGFSDTEIFDIVSVAAARAFFTKMLDGLGSEADSVFLKVNDTLRKALVVGRPIDYRHPETLPETHEDAVEA